MLSGIIVSRGIRSGQGGTKGNETLALEGVLGAIGFVIEYLSRLCKDDIVMIRRRPCRCTKDKKFWESG